MHQSIEGGMAKTDKERKQKQRERERAMGMKPFPMNLTTVERQVLADCAASRGFKDQTEYVLSLVYADRDKSRITK